MLRGSKNFYALNYAVTLEIARFAYGFWSDDFRKTETDVKIIKLMLFQENKNENVEIIVKDADNIPEKILKKFFRVR